jgi:hypothetical protein
MGILSLLVAGGGPSEFEFTATISSTTNSYNIYSAAQSAGWNTQLKLIANVTINSGISVYNGFSTGSGFPPGSTLNLTNNGVIVGLGGNAGNTGVNQFGNPGNGGTTGLNAGYPITIDNGPGRVAGGGGGGGGASGGIAGSPKTPIPYAGGGGGGGLPFGNGGPGAAPGNPGTLTAAGGRGCGTNCGGNGGGYGSSGGNGDSAPGKAGSNGGASGAAVVGNSFITWTNFGTRNGPIT